MSSGHWGGRLRAIGLGRIVGLVLLFALAVLRVWDAAPLEELRLRTFDFYQFIQPRDSKLRPAVIVDIDEESLRKLGQWPWPRTLVADLVRRLAALGAIAIGFDVIFAEADRYSPGSIIDIVGNLDAQTRARIRALPSNDQILAAAFRDAKVVVGESGLRQANGSGTPPQIGIVSMGADPTPYLIKFPGILRNIPILEDAAAGKGVLTIRPERDGIVRRVPLAVQAAGRTIPSLALAMLHVAVGSGPIIIRADEAGIQSIGIRELELPTDRNGQIWVHFGRSDANRYVSAWDVLSGRVPRDRIAQKLVLIGTSATGLLDRVTTPVDPIMPGVEVHAQIFENALTGAWISNPDYAMPAELVTALLVSLMIVIVAPALRALTVAALGLADSRSTCRNVVVFLHRTGAADRFHLSAAVGTRGFLRGGVRQLPARASRSVSRSVRLSVNILRPISSNNSSICRRSSCWAARSAR